MHPERLAHLIQAHQEALRSHPEEQEVHEAILSLLEGIVAGEITAARLAYGGSRAQALHFAGAPATAWLSHQAAADLERLQREEH